MNARVVTFSGPPDRLPDESRFRQHVLPTLQQQAGFKGATVLLDRSHGKVLGITYWESEQAADAAMQAMQPIRREQAAAMGVTEAPPDSYEVLYHG